MKKISLTFERLRTIYSIYLIDRCPNAIIKKLGKDKKSLQERFFHTKKLIRDEWKNIFKTNPYPYESFKKNQWLLKTNKTTQRIEWLSKLTWKNANYEEITGTNKNKTNQTEVKLKVGKDHTKVSY